jgi:predicted transcriptional regulator
MTIQLDVNQFIALTGFLILLIGTGLGVRHSVIKAISAGWESLAKQRAEQIIELKAEVQSLTARVKHLEEVNAELHAQIDGLLKIIGRRVEDKTPGSAEC